MILDVHHHMGAAEIAELFGVSRQRVQQLVARDDFPAPESVLAMGKVWRTEDVRRWGQEHGRLDSDAETSAEPAAPISGMPSSDLIASFASKPVDDVAAMLARVRNQHTAWLKSARQATAHVKGDQRTWTLLAMAVEAGYLTIES